MQPAPFKSALGILIVIPWEQTLWSVLSTCGGGGLLKKSEAHLDICEGTLLHIYPVCEYFIQVCFKWGIFVLLFYNTGRK